MVTGGDGVRRVAAFHWGLVPVWAKDVKVGAKMINARAETIAERSAFKRGFGRYRCLVPMDGFYEWQANTATGRKSAKQPMFIARRDAEPLAAAGLWSIWRDREAGRDAPWLHSCTIVTTSANETMAPIHDRMPVILPAAAWKSWLDPANHDLEQLSGLLVPAPGTLLTVRPVSPEVNKVANNGPELLDEYEPPEQQSPPPTLL